MTWFEFCERGMVSERWKLNLVGRTVFSVVILGWAILSAQPRVIAAETSKPTTMSKTSVVLALDSGKPLTIRATSQEHPPTITIEFPDQRVVGSLPERSVVSKGVIQAINARYEPRSDGQSKRFIHSIQIELSAPYTFHVQSESGRIIVDIAHPASIGSAAVEVGVRGGAIIGGLGQPTVSERFRAMQEALTRATPTSWPFQPAASSSTPTPVLNVSSVRSIAARVPTNAASLPGSGSFSRPGHDNWLVTWTKQPSPRASQIAAASLSRRTVLLRRQLSIALMCWLIFFGLLTAAVSVTVWLRRQGVTISALLGHAASIGTRASIPSGVLLIDQLIWRAFERRGYQLVVETELTQSLAGTLRVIAKEGTKAALMFVGNGPFFEKQTVERFLQMMREVKVEEGFLVASGSFTVPAQRLAKEHHVALVGREELTELLSVGAKSEYVAKQLEIQQARLQESQESLRRSSHELEALRRQRNEASWHLGEERAKSAKLDTQLAELTQQAHQQETQLAQWEQEASSLRKQWEESQWYLGEARARLRHLETQLASTQEIVKSAEVAQRERDESLGHLREEQGRREAIEQKLAELESRLTESDSRSRLLEAQLASVRQELSALHAFGERRRHPRWRGATARVDFFNGSEEPVGTGTIRDLSTHGIGVETTQELLQLPSRRSYRVRVSFEGHEPIESRAKLIWQHAEPSPAQHQSGYQFGKLPESARALIEQLITQSTS